MVEVALAISRCAKCNVSPLLGPAGGLTSKQGPHFLFTFLCTVTKEVPNITSLL